MPVQRPTTRQLQVIAQELGMHLSEAWLDELRPLLEPMCQAYDALQALPDYLPEVGYARTPGYRPEPADNPLNAWYIKTDIAGAPSGALQGRRVAVKDNICVAGVPMMNGSATLEGLVPDIDATVVTRVLDAGARIVGKTHCEDLCMSGGSHTNATGPVRNPWDTQRAAGGSSSGSAALVAAGEIDMALGSDTGGSVRIPAAFCGCYGMKPTHGLVPFTGAMALEMSCDHLGPITADVASNALLLEALAGRDGLDPRQGEPKVDAYCGALDTDPAGMRVALIREGFAQVNAQADVDTAVRAAAATIEALGVEVADVSMPMHALGAAVAGPITLEGLTELMVHGNGLGTNWKGLHPTSLLQAQANWRERADDLSASMKMSLLAGRYFRQRYHGRYYAKAQNLNRKLTRAYDALLQDYDVLLMPTVPMKATPLPAPDAPLAEQIQRATEMAANTVAFNATGHPAMSLPCGLREGLPVGMMLVGRHYDEASIYRLAHAFEQYRDWRTL